MHEYTLLLTDTCDIYSYTENKVGSITRPIETEVATDVPCKYRKSGLNTVENGVPTLVATHTLITKEDFLGDEGDRVVINSQGKKIELRLGEKIEFKTIPHFEFNCTREDIV